MCDARMIAQSLTNLLKNASEAIAGRRVHKPDPPGHITARLTTSAGWLAFEIEDNGVGLPAKDRDRLTEPYVTTRAKGTGLGLAIVGRVLEDHGGRIELKDASDFRPGQRGAWMRLRFALSGHASKIEVKERGADGSPPTSATQTTSEAKHSSESETQAATGC